MDSHLSIKPKLDILQQENVFLVYGDDPNKNLGNLKDKKVNLLKMPLKNNRIDLYHLISQLNEYGINNLLVEAGPTLSGEMIESGLYNNLVIYISPSFLGSETNNLIKTTKIKEMKQKINFLYKDIRRIGPDIRITLEPE